MKAETVPQEVIDAFTAYTPDLPAHSAGKVMINKISTGLINHSYKVICELKPDMFLQKINRHVFHRPQDVQENYISIWEYAEMESAGIRLPAPVYLDATHTLYRDENGDYWRAFELIENSKTILSAAKPTQANAVARAFARFTAAFCDMNLDCLAEVIPGFHDLGLRFMQFEEALQTELYERIAAASDLIKELKQRERYRHFFDVITESGEFPRRVMHHDAKISNILFHEKTGKVICPVDCDTVMPGYFFSDLGDMIRSMTGSQHEDQQSSDEIFIRKDFYEAIIDGYTSVLGDQLTPSEWKYIHSAGLIMIYMQALRFLTDYLNGDLYYKITYPAQNFDRANNQLTLLQKLEAYLKTEYSFSI